MQDEINKLTSLRNALQRFRQRHVVSSSNFSEAKSSEFSGDSYWSNSSTSSEEGFESDSAYTQQPKGTHLSQNASSLSEKSFKNNPQSSSYASEASFNVYLTGMSNRIATIKAIREFLNCGLKEAMDFTDGGLPVRILENADREWSNDFKEKLETVGASVNVCAVGSTEDRMMPKRVFIPSTNLVAKQKDNGELGTKLGIGCLTIAVVVAVWTLFGEKGFLTACAIGIAIGIACRRK